MKSISHKRGRQPVKGTLSPNTAAPALALVVSDEVAAPQSGKDSKGRSLADIFVDFHRATRDAPKAASLIDILDPPHNELIARVERLFSIKGPEAAIHLLGEASSSVVAAGDLRHKFLVAIEVIAALKPTNAAQSMLAAQMIGTHNQGVEALRRSTTCDGS
jgi:hypothetical protein